MAVVNEVPLPGIGVRYEFVTLDGDRVAIVHHRSGVRELVLFERDDPDTSHDLVRLGPRTAGPWPSSSACRRSRRGSPSWSRTSRGSHRRHAGAAGFAPAVTDPRPRGWLNA